MRSGGRTASILSIRTTGTKTRGSRRYEPFERAITWKYLALAFRRPMRFFASTATSYASNTVSAVFGFLFLSIVWVAFFDSGGTNCQVSNKGSFKRHPLDSCWNLKWIASRADARSTYGTVVTVGGMGRLRECGFTGTNPTKSEVGGIQNNM